MSRGHPRSTHDDKRKWLRSHRELWDLPLPRLRDAMADAGLCSPLTYPADIGLRAMLAELKTESQELGARS